LYKQNQRLMLEASSVPQVRVCPAQIAPALGFTMAMMVPLIFLDI
jgi:hypothetical protein